MNDLSILLQEILLQIYKFPVYTTKSCPRTEPEWCERSVALNCNETNGYMCIPNEEITALLEFCYFVKKLIIPRGKEVLSKTVIIIEIKILKVENNKLAYKPIKNFFLKQELDLMLKF